MKNDKISLEIATLKKALEKPMPKVVKSKLEAKIDKLEKELKQSTNTGTEFAKKLVEGKKKVKELNQTEFSRLIKDLSKKPEYDFLKYLTKGQIKDDLKREAKPVGYRFAGRNNFKTPTQTDIKLKRGVYYENRSNRSDVDRQVRLAKGGDISKKLEVGVYRIGKPTKVVTNLYEQKIVEISKNGDIDTASDYARSLADFKNKRYESYPIITKEQLDYQYKKFAKGGEIGKELMGGQPNQKKPSGATLLEVRKNGKEIVVTEDDGKTKEVYVKSNGYSGYTLHYNGNHYEFAHSLKSMANGGEIGGYE
jgi:cell division septum initiation protein DivIVA